MDWLTEKKGSEKILEQKNKDIEVSGGKAMETFENEKGRGGVTPRSKQEISQKADDDP